jgi:HAD superfamily hydrolase (TIGR01509 family)
VTLKHVIFDCDGVLVDSEPLSMRADVMLLRRFGINISEQEAHQRFVGTTFQAMLDLMTRQHGISFPPDLHMVKNSMVEDLYRAELKAVDGIKDVLDDLKWRGLSMSIGSNSPKARVELAIELTGIASYFDHIVSFEDVVEGKPKPDIFLLAARRASVEPHECLVVEDSETGMTAAVAAGIRAIGFTGTHADPQSHGARLKAIGASQVVLGMRGVLENLG